MDGFREVTQIVDYHFNQVTETEMKVLNEALNYLVTRPEFQEGKYTPEFSSATNALRDQIAALLRKADSPDAEE